MKLLLSCIGIAVIVAMWIPLASSGRPLRNKTEDRELRALFQKQLGQLENEAGRIEDVRALKRLQRAYGYYIGRGMWNQAAARIGISSCLRI